MMPMTHPWIEWQEEVSDSDKLYAWRWKENTPKKIIEQYEEWEKYYNKMMKIKF